MWGREEGGREEGGRRGPRLVLILVFTGSRLFLVKKAVGAEQLLGVFIRHWGEGVKGGDKKEVLSNLSSETPKTGERRYHLRQQGRKVHMQAASIQGVLDKRSEEKRIRFAVV